MKSCVSLARILWWLEDDTERNQRKKGLLSGICIIRLITGGLDCCGLEICGF